MKVTFINPASMIYSFGHQTDVHDYFAEYIKLFKPNVFLTTKKQYLALLGLMYYKKIPPTDFRLIHTLEGLKRNSDVVFYPWGYPTTEEKIEDLQQIFRHFNGMKILHAMDFHYKADECNEFCSQAGIDYIMGYSRYDLHSDYFRSMFPHYIDKVIDVPFGYSKKWISPVPFSQRKNRCLGSGTIESFDWLIKTFPKAQQNYSDYFNFFREFHSMHELRWLINQQSSALNEVIDMKFHNKSLSHANYIPDIVGLFNEYKLFINDESLLNFPPIRTYEGIASGCVMVAHDSGCYRDYGFEPGTNYIAFNKYDLSDLADKIKYYLFTSPDGLETIRKNGYTLVTEKYNHKAVAKLMHQKIRDAFLAEEAKQND